MKFTCAKETLSEAISICSHAVSAKASTPILEGLLIKVQKGEVTLTGFNYKTGIQRSFAADRTEDGEVVINARILGDIVRKMPSADITVHVDEKLMANIRCGSSEFNIVAGDAKEFPEMPFVGREKGVTLPNSLLKDMIGGTIFAVCENENKPIITGSLFEVEGKQLRMVSVDGYRLAVRTEHIDSLSGEDCKFVVPGQTLRDIARILPDDDTFCVIYPQRKHALFVFENTVVTTRLLEGEFLNYKAAIPEDQPVNIVLEKSEIVSAVERVSLIISERLKNPVRCNFDAESLQLSCITAVGRSYDELRIPDCGAQVEIGFNNRYLLDALRACPDEKFVLGLKSSLSPCTIRPVEGDRFTYLVLPVRLKAGN